LFLYKRVAENQYLALENFQVSCPIAEKMCFMYMAAILDFWAEGIVGTLTFLWKSESENPYLTVEILQNIVSLLRNG
jgi:hypothetical protein